MNKSPFLTEYNRPTSARSFQPAYKENEFVTLAVVFILLWVMALGFGYTLGGFIHILLVSATVMALFAYRLGRHTP